MERDFQERIVRAKEAVRLASIAAMARQAPPSVSVAPPPPPTGPLPPPPVSSAFNIAAVPDDVRHRIDHLVDFIARNGPAFEEAARARERMNPDFAFLHAGGPYHDYFQWRKRQTTTPPRAAALPPGPGGPPPPRPPANWTLPPSPHTTPVDPIMGFSVGAMADACKISRMRRMPTYSPLPPDLLAPATVTAALRPIEPARLETRLADFYRLSP